MQWLHPSIQAPLLPFFRITSKISVGIKFNIINSWLNIIRINWKSENLAFLYYLRICFIPVKFVFFFQQSIESKIDESKNENFSGHSFNVQYKFCSNYANVFMVDSCFPFLCCSPKCNQTISVAVSNSYWMCS